MLENASQAIAGDFAASQELWNTPSQVCSIAACGWALSLIVTKSPELFDSPSAGVIWGSRKGGDGVLKSWSNLKTAMSHVKLKKKAVSFVRLTDNATDNAIVSSCVRRP